MGRPYTEWDEKEIKQLEEMKKDGYTVKQISQKLGRGEANNHVHGTNIIKNLDGEVWCCEKTISLESHPPSHSPKHWDNTY